MKKIDDMSPEQARYVTIAFGLGMLVFLVIAAYYVQSILEPSDMKHVNSTNYDYNMTKQELFDERVTDACIELQITNKECSTVYGGINTGNGEAIK